MATRKTRKSKSRRKGRTVRRRRTSTAGKVYPPLDVRSKKDLHRLAPLVKNGNLTVFFVWAKWCPHCHTAMPHFDAASKSPSRTVNSVKVEEQMLPAVNEILTKQVNRAAKPLNVEGYPSIIVVDKNANKVTDIEPVRDTAVMTQVMANAGPLANKAGLTNENVQNAANMVATPPVATPPNNSMNIEEEEEVPQPVNTNKNQKNKNKAFLANIGMEGSTGLVNASNPRNIDVGEDELLGSIASKNNKGASPKLKSLSTNALANAGTGNNKAPKNTLQKATAPSSLNMFNTTEERITPPPASIKKLYEEAGEVTSLAAPLAPPAAVNDLEETRNVRSISNNLTAEQKVSGGGYGDRRGGSLYASLARSTYTLAPAAALLATAAVVMRGKKRMTRKRSKKSRRSLRRRR